MKNKNKKGLILTVSELQAIGCEEKVLASPEQAQRRSLLHDLMVAEDFCPHFMANGGTFLTEIVNGQLSTMWKKPCTLKSEINY